MSEQPEALRLAHELILAMRDTDIEHWDALEQAAAELRRLHYLNEARRDTHEALGLRITALEAEAASLRDQNTELDRKLAEMEQRRDWQGLTEEEKLVIRRLPWETPADLIANTEDKLREKNA